MATNDTLTIIDNRTGKQYTVPIHAGAIRAMDLRKIKVDDDDFGLLSYDPSYGNTAACRSSITYIDGDQGILEYRGYPIEQLAENCSFGECAYLVLFGELPTESQLREWSGKILSRMWVHEKMKTLMEGFLHDAHPMAILSSTVAALSTFYPECKNIHDPENRALQINRLIAKMPSIIAYAYRHRLGLPYVYPDEELGYVENFQAMLWKRGELRYQPNPVLTRALEVLFILHLDHEQNCSSTTMRTVGSAHADPYVATAAACAALYGPLHGGANEAVLKMLAEIGSKANIPAYLENVKRGECRLMGFGHRVYKNYDPRAKIIKRIAEEVFEVTGRNPLIDIAVELERIALSEDYFVTRKLYPNVDFYSGIIYQAMGFDPSIFTVLFALPRTPGWLAQWQELLEDPEQKISRPRQIYTGARNRTVVPMSERSAAPTASVD